MPTDVNDLKDQQTVCVRASVFGEVQSNADFVSVKLAGVGVFAIPHTSIITEWPPEPSADAAGWERIGGGKDHIFEYREQRRLLAPKWVPTVGEKAMILSRSYSPFLVNYIGKSYAYVTECSSGMESLALLTELTQPKEQPHDQD